ncbi:MAG: TRAP transporter small permease [Ignavibacteriales bacterium]|nr:TRAP transporter small permease [Ignavibacteriales bacterium]
MNLERIRSAVDKVLEWVLITIVAVMTLNVLWQVFTRFIMKSPSSYTEELARYLLVWLGLLGGAYAVGKKMHLSIDLLPMKLKGKSRLILELVIQGCIVLFATAVVLVGGAELVGLTLTLEQLSAALRIKLGYVYLALPLSGTLMIFYSITFILETLRGFKEHA